MTEREPRRMLAILRRPVRRTRALTLAGLAAGTVPLAIAVHLLAELAATGRAIDPAFALRHAYLLVPFVAALAAFAATVGLGTSRREFVRLSSLARADLANVGMWAGLRTLFLANVGFFVATQAVEGVPIATGSLITGCAVATLGSLIAAFVVFALGRSIDPVALVAGFALAGPALPRPLAVSGEALPARSAGRVFSLFIPNRPPPLPTTT